MEREKREYGWALKNLSQKSLEMTSSMRYLELNVVYRKFNIF